MTVRWLEAMPDPAKSERRTEIARMGGQKRWADHRAFIEAGEKRAAEWRTALPAAAPELAATAT